MTAIPTIEPAEDVVQMASSAAADTATAMREVLEAVGAANAALTQVYFSPRHDAQVVAHELFRYAGPRGFGGTSGGEIGPDGFQDGTIVAIALHGPHVRAGVHLVTGFSSFNLLRVASVTAQLARAIGRDLGSLDPSRHVWMLHLDGLAGREDCFTPYFATHAPRLPLVGGSFADGERMEQVKVVAGGGVHHDAGVVVLLEYDRPFEVLCHTHLEFTERWVEVTDTAQQGRLLTGLDGRPALEVYAEALGLAPTEIAPDIAGSAAFGFRFRGRPFPCSVMRADRRGLLLAYAVQRGDRLNVLANMDLVGKTRAAIGDAVERMRAGGHEPQAMLAFNCLGRFREARRRDELPELFDAMHQLPIIGLNTYGEQFGPRHMNHSLTGIIFG